MRQRRLQRVDVLHQRANSLQALGLTELNVETLFDITDQFCHIQRIDTEFVKRCAFNDLFRLDVEVFVQDFLQSGYSTRMSTASV